MKIILSRKGFDSSSGGCTNPIMPDGTLLSLPIPEKNTLVKYGDLQYGGHTYKKILEGLRPCGIFESCHLDPDIRDGIHKNPIKGWRAAFGQRDSALSYLRNAKVTVGDLFLFFGVFRKTEYYNDSIRFKKGEKPVQIVFGYMQIGGILDTPKDIARYYWHPHATNKHYNKDKNTIYLPSEKLSFCPSFPGYGIFSYRPDRILTKSGENAATWKEHGFLMPHNIMGDRKNSSKGGGVYYAGQWQELVLKPSVKVEKWAKNLIE
jgi:hypothetical protein